MVRPKTQGPVLSFRLSLPAWEELVRRAGRKGLSPPIYLKEQIERSLGSVVEAGSTEPQAPPLPRMVSAQGCRHWRKTVTADGVFCLQCGVRVAVE